MDIKSLWNKFLELRKSPICIIMALIGLLDIILWSFDILFILVGSFSLKNIALPNQFFYIIGCGYFIFRGYLCYRIVGIVYYLILFLIAFIFEKIINFKIKNNIIENSKIYKNIWIIGIIGFIIGTIIIPFMKQIEFLWNFF